MPEPPRTSTCRVRAALAASLFALAIATAGLAQAARPIVILISIDGWRWDYLERFKPPTMLTLAKAGVRAEALIPIFPSKTFPNHYTLITGLYPDRHGIVSNSMTDPNLPGRFTLRDRGVQQDTRWWGGEPLWVTAQQQGQLAAPMFWPGSDVEIDGQRPRYYRTFEDELPNEERVDQLLTWLEQPEAMRPTFLTLYFSTMDNAGHQHGPESPEVAEAAAIVDRLLARLVDRVRAQGLESRVNYLLVSDHGMAALARERTIVLDDYLDVSTIEIIDTSPVVTINPIHGSADAIYAALKDKHPSLAVYRRENLPLEYRLRNHPRLPAVIGVADDGWHVTTRDWLAHDKNRTPGGTHGYDPAQRSMHGLFIASGPKFKRGLVVSPFLNIHVYELICRVLGLRPAPNDGDPMVTAAFLR